MLLLTTERLQSLMGCFQRSNLQPARAGPVTLHSNSRHRLSTKKSFTITLCLVWMVTW